MTENHDGTVTYTPVPGFHGFDKFTYKISDGNCNWAAANVFIDVSVQIQNAPPEANDDYETTRQNTPVSINVLTNDKDPDQDPLKVTEVTNGEHGRTTVDTDGVVIYIPDKGFSGNDIFTYTIKDTKDGMDTASVHVTVNKEEASNRPPTAGDDSANTSKNTSVVIPVLANDSDPDGDTLTVTDAAYPANGSVRVNADNTVTYSPNTGFTGNDEFTYHITDGKGGSNSALVTVSVTETGDGGHHNSGSSGSGSGRDNEPPLAVDDTAKTKMATAVTVEVLANDSDPDGDTIKLKDFGQPSHGKVSFDTEAGVIYTPDSGYKGTDQFSYTIVDEHGLSSTANVSVTVEADSVIPRPPVPQTPEDKVTVLPTKVPAGDPTISVYPGQDVKRVFAVLPDGRKLELKQKENVWKVSFMVPFGTADGPYKVKVFLVDVANRTRESGYTITIDNSLPLMKMKTQMQKDGRQLLEVRPLFNAVAVKYETNEQVVFLKSSKGTWAGIVPAGKGRIVATDESGYKVVENMELATAKPETKRVFVESGTQAQGSVETNNVSTISTTLRGTVQQSEKCTSQRASQTTILILSSLTVALLVICLIKPRAQQ